MQLIPLEAIPNQEFTLNLDGNRWLLKIKAAVNSMGIDVYLNDIPVLLGQRIVAGVPILPYRYLKQFGNFILLTENDDTAEYTKFNISQTLIYASIEELLAIPDAPLDWPELNGYAIKTLDPLSRITSDFRQRVLTDGQFRIVSI